MAEIWRKQVAKSRSDEFNPTPGAQGTFICSNHFPLGKRTPTNPETDYPFVFMTVSEYHHASTPKKRKMNRMQEQSSATRSTRNPRRCLDRTSDSASSDDSDEELPNQDENTVKIPLRFEQFTREFEVKFYTGLPSTECFKCVFDFLLPKARTMQYWRGAKQTEKETSKVPSTPFQLFAGSGKKSGPPRKLSLEQEILLTLMKLCLALLTEDLAFRFQVSSATASSIFINRNIKRSVYCQYE